MSHSRPAALWFSFWSPPIPLLDSSPILLLPGPGASLRLFLHRSPFPLGNCSSPSSAPLQLLPWCTFSFLTSLSPPFSTHFSVFSSLSGCLRSLASAAQSTSPTLQSWLPEVPHREASAAPHSWVPPVAQGLQKPAPSLPLPPLSLPPSSQCWELVCLSSGSSRRQRCLLSLVRHGAVPAQLSLIHYSAPHPPQPPTGGSPVASGPFPAP